jgi:hypothetical protein
MFMGGMKMSTKKFGVLLTGLAGVLLVAMPAVAGSLAEQFASCAQRYATTSRSASVMLECTAADGKLTNCHVLEAPTPVAGFDRAAMCVAEALPIGTRTGTIKVPIKFEPMH